MLGRISTRNYKKCGIVSMLGKLSKYKINPFIILWVNINWFKKYHTTSIDATQVSYWSIMSTPHEPAHWSSFEWQWMQNGIYRMQDDIGERPLDTFSRWLGRTIKNTSHLPQIWYQMTLLNETFPTVYNMLGFETKNVHPQVYALSWYTLHTTYIKLLIHTLLI